MSEQFNQFLEFCKDNLPSSKATLFLKLMKKRYKECDISYKKSDTFYELLVDTEAKITNDKGRIFVHILQFLETLKINEGIGCNKRGLGDSSSEADSDVNPSKKRKFNQESSSECGDKKNHAYSESEDNDSGQSSSKGRISNRKWESDSDSVTNTDTDRIDRSNRNNDLNDSSEENNDSDVNNDGYKVNEDSDTNNERDKEKEGIFSDKESEVYEDSDENNDKTLTRKTDDESEPENQVMSEDNENVDDDDENTSVIFGETCNRMYSSSEEESDVGIKTNKHITDFIHSTIDGDDDDDDVYNVDDDDDEDGISCMVNDNDDKNACNDDDNDDDNSELPTETESTLPDISEDVPTKDSETFGTIKDISVELIEAPECMDTSNDEAESIDYDDKNKESKNAVECSDNSEDEDSDELPEMYKLMNDINKSSKSEPSATKTKTSEPTSEKACNSKHSSEKSRSPTPSAEKSSKKSNKTCIEKAVSEDSTRKKDLAEKCNKGNEEADDVVEIYVSDSDSEPDANDSKVDKTIKLTNEKTNGENFKDYNDENKAPKMSVEHSGYDSDKHGKKNARKPITSSDDEDPDYAAKAKKFREKCKKKYVVCTGSKKRKNSERSTSPPIAKTEKKQKVAKSPRKNKGKRSPKKSSPSKSPIVIVTDSDSSVDNEIGSVKRKLDIELASKFEEENDIDLNRPIVVLDKVKTGSLKLDDKQTNHTDITDSNRKAASDVDMESGDDNETNDSDPSDGKGSWQVVDTESSHMIIKKRVNLETLGKVDDKSKEPKGNIEKTQDEENFEDSDHDPSECVDDQNVETEVAMETDVAKETKVVKETNEEPGPSTSDANDKKKKASVRQIKKLEHLLEKIRDQIEDVRSRELSVEDLESDISDYILEDKLQRKFMKVWDKLCELHKAVKTTGRPTDKYFRYQGTRYPDVNRKVEKFINKKKTFPDYHDIRNIITKVNKDKRLHIRSREIDDLSKEVFTDVGNQLQKRRQKDFVSTFQMPGAEVNAFSLYDDPALYDPDLKKKLDTNKKMAKTKMEQVVEKYAQLQYEVDDKTDEEDDDDNDDDDNVDSNTGIDDIDTLISGVDNSESESVDDKLMSHDKEMSDDKKRSGHDIHDPVQGHRLEKPGSSLKRSVSPSLPLHRLVKSNNTIKHEEETRSSKTKSFHEQLGLSVNKKETTITILSDDDDDNEIKLDPNCQAPADDRLESDEECRTEELNKTPSHKNKTSVDITIVTDNEDDDDEVTQEPLELKIRNFRHVSLDELDKIHAEGFSDDSDVEDEEILEQSKDDINDGDKDFMEQRTQDFDSNVIEDNDNDVDDDVDDDKDDNEKCNKVLMEQNTQYYESNVIDDNDDEEGEGLPNIDVYIDKDHSFEEHPTEELPTEDYTDVTCVAEQVNDENDVTIIENDLDVSSSAKCVNISSQSSAKFTKNSSSSSAKSKDNSCLNSAKFTNKSGSGSAKYVNNSINSAKFIGNSSQSSAKYANHSGPSSARYVNHSNSAKYTNNSGLSSAKYRVNSAKPLGVSSAKNINSSSVELAKHLHNSSSGSSKHRKTSSFCWVESKISLPKSCAISAKSGKNGDNLDKSDSDEEVICIDDISHHPKPDLHSVNVSTKSSNKLVNSGLKNNETPPTPDIVLVEPIINETLPATDIVFIEPKNNQTSQTTPDIVFVEPDVASVPCSVSNISENKIDGTNDATSSELVQSNEEIDSGTCTVSTEIDKSCLMEGEAEISTQTSDNESGALFTATLLKPSDIAVNTTYIDTDNVIDELADGEAVDNKSVSDMFESYENGANTGNIDSLEYTEEVNNDLDATLEDIDDDLNENEAKEGETEEFETGESEVNQMETQEYETGESEVNQMDTLEFETGESEANQMDTQEFETSENDVYQNETLEFDTGESDAYDKETLESEGVDNESINCKVNESESVDDVTSNASSDDEEPISETNDQLNNTSSCDIDTIAGVSVKHPDVRNKLLKEETDVSSEPIIEQSTKQCSKSGAKQCTTLSAKLCTTKNSKSSTKQCTTQILKPSTQISQVKRQVDVRGNSGSSESTSRLNDLTDEQAELIENYQEPEISNCLKSNSNFESIIILSDSE